MKASLPHVQYVVAASFLACLGLSGCGPQTPNDSQEEIPSRQASEPAGPPSVFPIGGYAPLPERDLAAGFTIAGPVYSKKDEMLALCKDANLPFFYPIGMPIDFLGKQGDPVDEIDLHEVREEIRRQVEAVMASDTIMVWYVTPEELRFWRPLEMDYLQTVVEIIKETDPENRPVWMYEPNNRTAESLSKTLPFQDKAGKGVYTNLTSRKNERAWVSWTLGEQQAAINAVRPSATPIAVLEMFQEPEEDERGLLRTWARHDSYASLLSGARCIVIFSFGHRPNFASKDIYYEAYAEVARELNGDLALGAVFLDGSPAEVPGFQVIQGSDSVVLTGGSSGPAEDTRVPSLRTGSYDWHSKRYTFFVNSSPDEVVIQLNHPGEWNSLFDEEPDLAEDRRTLTLPAWGVAAFQTPMQ